MAKSGFASNRNKSWGVSLSQDNDVAITATVDCHTGKRVIEICQPSTAYKTGEIICSIDEADELARKLTVAANYAREQALGERPRRVMRVRWSKTASESGIEVYYLQASNGSFRKQNKIPGNGQYVPDCAEIYEWLKKLRVTHIQPFDDYHEDMPDNILCPVKKYIKWLRKCEDEA